MKQKNNIDFNFNEILISLIFSYPLFSEYQPIMGRFYGQSE